MPSEDPNSPKTRLLTLLNVSASRSSKKRRLDALLVPEETGPRKKLNARKVTEPEATPTVSPENEIAEDESSEEEAEEETSPETSSKFFTGIFFGQYIDYTR